MAPLKLSLRGHKAPISCITRYDNDLVSADRDGWIILWSLRTKRPIAVWKAHEGHILTLKKTSMGLLSHGRDSNIRLWDLSNASIKNCSKETSVVGSETNSPSPSPKFEEVPVNALNFCNVEFWEMKTKIADSDSSSGLVATPATVDSDNFDVYKVTKTKSDFSIQRIVENFSVNKAEPEKNGIEEVNSPELMLQLRGHGIIMRLLFVAENLLFVGYESGAIFAFKLEQKVKDVVYGKNRSIVNNDIKAVLVLALLGHTPLPVLSLEYDFQRKIVYSGSASKKVLCLDVSKLMETAGSIIVKTNLVTNKISEERSKVGAENDKESDSSEVITPNLNKWGLPEKTKTTSMKEEMQTIQASSKLQDDSASGSSNTNSSNSTNGQLDLINLLHQTFTNLKHYGIQNIQITETGYVTAFWDGVIKAFNERSEPVFELERAEEAIKLSQDNELSGSSKKSLCIYAWQANFKQEVSTKTSIFSRSLSAESLLFVGYTDGLIRAYAFI